MCGVPDELKRKLKMHDRLNELEAFLEKEKPFVGNREWWLIHAAKIRRLLAPFDESTKKDERRCYKDRRSPNAIYESINQRVYTRRKLDRWNVVPKRKPHYSGDPF